MLDLSSICYLVCDWKQMYCTLSITVGNERVLCLPRECLGFLNVIHKARVENFKCSLNDFSIVSVGRS